MRTQSVSLTLHFVIGDARKSGAAQPKTVRSVILFFARKKIGELKKS